jgi:hypothetical protein
VLKVWPQVSIIGGGGTFLRWSIGEVFRSLWNFKRDRGSPASSFPLSLYSLAYDVSGFALHTLHYDILP